MALEIKRTVWQQMAGYESDDAAARIRQTLDRESDYSSPYSEGYVDACEDLFRAMAKLRPECVDSMFFFVALLESEAIGFSFVAREYLLKVVQEEWKKLLQNTD